MFAKEYRVLNDKIIALCFSCRISRPFVAFCDSAWSYMALLWPFHGLIGDFYIRFIVVYGLLWQNVDLIGLVSSFLAVIDPNSFGLVSLVKTFHKTSYNNRSETIISSCER